MDKGLFLETTSSHTNANIRPKNYTLQRAPGVHITNTTTFCRMEMHDFTNCQLNMLLILPLWASRTNFQTAHPAEEKYLCKLFQVEQFSVCRTVSALEWRTANDAGVVCPYNGTCSPVALILGMVFLFLFVVSCYFDCGNFSTCFMYCCRVSLHFRVRVSGLLMFFFFFGMSNINPFCV